jgi:hypothetical protein
VATRRTRVVKSEAFDALRKLFKYPIYVQYTLYIQPITQHSILPRCINYSIINVRSPSKNRSRKKPLGDKITTLDDQPFTAFLLTSVGIVYNSIKFNTRVNNMDVLHHNNILNNLMYI